MEIKIFEVISSQSSIGWMGKKVTGSHNGTIAIKSGTLTVNNDKLIFGKFIIDTTSINVLDITDPALNAQFKNHLLSDDFFSSAKYPAATYEITSATPGADKNYRIEGKLTIKNITQPVVFEAVVNADETNLTATGKITIDRTKFDMKFRSGSYFKNLGETLIYNDFDLAVNLTAKII